MITLKKFYKGDIVASRHEVNSNKGINLTWYRVLESYDKQIFIKECFGNGYFIAHKVDFLKAD